MICTSERLVCGQQSLALVFLKGAKAFCCIGVDGAGQDALNVSLHQQIRAPLAGTPYIPAAISKLRAHVLLQAASAELSTMTA